MNDKLLTNLNDQLSNLHEVRLFIDKVYYNQQFANMFNQLLLSMADQAAEFIENILGQFRTKYKVAQEEGKNGI
jgi:hypothetical protein